jgi:hypothetical protein
MELACPVVCLFFLGLASYLCYFVVDRGMDFFFYLAHAHPPYMRACGLVCIPCADPNVT